MSPTDQLPPEEVEARLRAALHAAADPVEPDPGGWRRVQARVGRRRSVARGTGLALAGAAAAVVAVAVVSTGGPEVGFAPVASPPAAPEADATPATAGPEAAGPEVVGPDVAGLLVTDGSSIHVTDVSGAVRSTPARGEGTSTVTDLAVRPGGTLADFTMAYRYDVVVDSPEPCGDISWTRVVESEGNVAGGGLPGVDTRATGECLGAPVFAYDGTALGWLATAATGEVALQLLDWGVEGPSGCCVTTFPLTLEPGVTATDLVELRLVPDGGQLRGQAIIRVSDDGGPHLRAVEVERQADGAIALVGTFGDPLVNVDGEVLVDRDGAWSIVRPAGDLYWNHVAPDGSISSAPVTTPDDLPVDPDEPVSLHALGRSAVITFRGMARVVTVEPDGSVSGSAAVSAVAAAPLAASEQDAGPSAPPASPGPTEAPAPELQTRPSDPPASPSSTEVQATEQPPSAVLATAAAIREAAQARDWEAVADLIPPDGFTSNFGGEADHIVFYQREEAAGVDVLGTLADLLAADPVPGDGGLWVWPEAYLQDGYLGYRVGIAADGTWRFYVAGD